MDAAAAMGADCQFHQFFTAWGEVMVNSRFKPRQMTNCGVHGEAMFYNKYWMCIFILVFGFMYLLGRQNAQCEEPITWTVKDGWCIYLGVVLPQLDSALS